MRRLALALALITLIACNRDPNVAKQRYLENGNKYFSREKYREASIMYRNALQKDLRFGPAHYRLALTELKLGQIGAAVKSLRRAIDLLPPGSADRRDASVKLAELYLTYSRPDNQQVLDDVDRIVQDLLKQNASSFDGHRLNGDLLFMKARGVLTRGDTAKMNDLLNEAIAEYRTAAALRPADNPIQMALARSLAASRQFPESEKLYGQVLGRDPHLIQAYTELYQVYLLQNKSAEGESLLKRAIAANPKQYEFMTLLAAYYFGSQRRADMVQVLNQIKSHAKDYPQAYLTVGDFYLRMGDGDDAIQQYKEGIAQDEKQKLTYQKRIIEVLMREGKRSEAASLNSEILKSNPRDNDARGLSASLLLDKGEVQKAVAELQSVVTAAPGNFVARYHLGRAHVARQEWEQARQQFTEAIRLRPDYLPARLALAQLQAARGEFDVATKSVQDILRIDPQSAQARLIQSAILMGQRNYTDSQKLLEAMAKANPNSPEVWYQLGVVSLAQSKYKAASDSFSKAYQLNPANSRGLMGIVETDLAQNKTEEAVQTLQAEAQRFPARADIRLALGNTAVRAGKFDLALSEFNQVLGMVPKGSKTAGQVYLRIGETYRRKGDLNNGVAALQKAHEALPDNPDILSTLALALDGVGRKQEARQAYEDTLRLDPRNGVALNNLAFLLADGGGDLNQALTYAQRAKQVLPNLYEVSDTLGWIYLKKNLSDDAIEIFRQLVQKQPSHSTYRYHLGMALSQKGDRLQAVQELQQALKDNPPKDEETKIRALLGKLG